jgi:membrane dipeptidase
VRIVFDAHSDILNDIHPRRMLGEKDLLEKFWIPKMRSGLIDVRVLAIYNGPKHLPENGLRRSLDLIATLDEELEASPSSVLCRTYEEIRKAKDEGKIAWLLGMEGAEPLDSDIQLLRIFYRLGVRILGLTHVLRNSLADGAAFTPRKRGHESGLSELGFEFLAKAQSMGFLIDVSHLNEPGFWDVMKATSLPVIASHSNCRALFDHPRNLTDDQLRAVAATGGVIGINACSAFYEKGDLEDFIDHVVHTEKVAGIHHVGLGPDFADYFIDHMTDGEKANLQSRDFKSIEGLGRDEDMRILPRELQKRGYKQREIDQILGLNFMGVLKDTLKPFSG